MFGITNWGIWIIVCSILGLPIAGIIDKRRGTTSFISIIIGAVVAFIVLYTLRLALIELNIL